MSITIRLTILLIIIINNCCKNSSAENKNLNVLSDVVERKFTDVKSIEKDSVRVELITSFLSDTLVGKWANEGFDSPIVEKQILIFFLNDKIIRSHFFSIDTLAKETNLQNLLMVPAFPILDLCLLKSKDIDLCYVYGADFCNGVECPEFIGLYNLTGGIIYEGISTIGPLSKSYKSLEEIKNEYGININKPYDCQSILNYWNNEAPASKKFN